MYRKTTKQYQAQLDSIYGYHYYIVKSPYKNGTSKIKVLHSVCDHILNPVATDLLRQRYWHHPYCPYCSRIRLHNQRTKTTKEFKKQVDDKWHGLIQVIGKYKNKHTPIKVQCSACHNIWYPLPNYIIGKEATGCPFCNNSGGERMVGNYLNKLGLTISSGRSCINPDGDAIWGCCDIKWLNGKHLDYYIPKLRIGIEMNGVQHFKPTQFGNESKFDAINSYHKQVKNDQVKRRDCKLHGVKLISINNIHNYKNRKLYRLITNVLNKDLKPYLNGHKYHGVKQLKLF